MESEERRAMVVPLPSFDPYYHRHFNVWFFGDLSVFSMCADDVTGKDIRKQ